MAGKKGRDKRGRTGYGSSYRKADTRDMGGGVEIPAVLGGQLWMVKPDKKADVTHPCIWMQAGVAAFKDCSNFYDCPTCRYDKGMKKKAARGAQPPWQEAMRKRSGLDRVCRHSLTHRISNRQCAADYSCDHCDFDQFLEDVWSVRTGTAPREVQQVRGFNVPMDHYFHNGHTWARVESGGYIRVGMDDFALKVLGAADSLDLPLMGKELEQGSAGWGLKRKKNTADVLSPVDGVIVEVNHRLRETPLLANRDPYDGGWFFAVRTPDVKGTIRNLMDDTDGLRWTTREVDVLEGMIESVVGPLAADGGFLSDDIYAALPELGWNNLTAAFLKSRS